MNGWKCNACGQDFTDPLWIPEYVDDLRPTIPAYDTPVCPFCMNDDIAEIEDPEDEDE